MKPKAKVTAERHGGKIAIAQQSSPINLVAADAYFGLHDPELAGLAVVMMRGDTMEPFLKSGDFALIDTRDTCVTAGIFAVLYEKSVCLMQLQRVYSGRSKGLVKRLFPNPLYGRGPYSHQFTIGEDLEIIGRVVQKLTRHL